MLEISRKKNNRGRSAATRTEPVVKVAKHTDEDGNQYDEKPLESLCCSITASGDLMQDPVFVILTDNNTMTYEKDERAKWLKKSDVDPETGAKVENKKLLPNILARRAIEEWKQIHLMQKPTLAIANA